MTLIEDELKALEATRDYAKIIARLVEALDLQPDQAAYSERLAQVYLKVGAVDKAIETYLNCAEKYGAHAKYALNLGHAYKASGALDQAIQAYQDVAENPEDKVAVTGLWSLANLKQYDFSQAEALKLTQLSESQALNPGYQSLASFALGAHWERAADFDKAFQAFVAANDVVAQIRPFHGDRYQQLIKTLMDFVHSPSSEASNAVEAPIFIVGMPRSGSTLVEQILSAHSCVESTDELMFLGDMARVLEDQGGYASRIRRLQPERLQALAEQYLRLTAVFRSESSPMFIDKNPNNFLHIGLIKRIFPRAKIINVIRDPLDNALSVFSQFFAEGHEYSYSLQGIIFYWQGYLTLMKHWDSLFPGEVFHLDYEKLVSNSETETTALLDYCDLKPEALCYTPHLSPRAVMTPSAAQVRLPISTANLGSGLRYKNQMMGQLPQLASIKHLAGQLFLGA